MHGRICKSCQRGFATPDPDARMCGRCEESKRRVINRRACEYCSKEFDALAASSMYCSKACKYRARDDQRGEYFRAKSREKYQRDPAAHNERTAKPERRAAANGVAYEPVEPVEIFERDRWVCQICRKKVDRALRYPDPLCASIDHVIPWALGGSHTRDNLQCSHLICNLRKATKTMKEVRGARSPAHPRPRSTGDASPADRERSRDLSEHGAPRPR